MTLSSEDYRAARQSSHMFQLSVVVFGRVVGLHRADEEELWVAARPKGPSLRQYPPAPSGE